MFNFGRSGFTNPRTGKKLHVIMTLIDMREASGVSNDDRDALKHAIEYIKALEAEVRSITCDPIDITHTQRPIIRPFLLVAISQALKNNGVR